MVIIDSHQLPKDFGIGVVQRLTLNTTGDDKITLAPKRKRVLADMITQCDLKAAPPADLALWGVAQPMGGEVFRWRFLNEAIL